MHQLRKGWNFRTLTKEVLKMYKVLVVEGDHRYFAMMEAVLLGRVEILRAETLEEGKQLFHNHLDVDLIIMDACAPGNESNTMEFINKLANAGYNKPVIASSSVWQYTQKLVMAGGTHRAEKHNVADKALSLLGIT